MTALTWVESAGPTRVKVVPDSRLDTVAKWGVGTSPVFDVYLVDDSMRRRCRRRAGDGARLLDLAASRAWGEHDRRRQRRLVYVLATS